MWKCGSKSIEYGKKTLIMAIINATPDSFSDGGEALESEAALKRALEAEEHGADIIDIGAQSTRPGFKPVSAEEEWQRLEKPLRLIRKSTALPVSVDTFYPEVARRAAQSGADIINDVSGILTPQKVQALGGLGLVITFSAAGGAKEAARFFEKAVAEAKGLGIKKEQLCLDPGIGFSKSRAQDLELIARAGECKAADLPLLLGFSRKRVIGKYSHQSEPKKRVYGNIAADTAAIFAGADILRLHDVKSEIQGVLLADALKKIKQNDFKEENL